jgi:hypothetical protein
MAANVPGGWTCGELFEVRGDNHLRTGVPSSATGGEQVLEALGETGWGDTRRHYLLHGDDVMMCLSVASSAFPTGRH